MEVSKILKRFQNAVAKRNKFKQLYEEVYKYIMPDQYLQLENNNSKEGEQHRLHLYTSTPEQAADKFVQRVQSLLTPVNKDWIGFEAGFAYTANNNDPVEVNQQLQRVSKSCNVFKDVSNFDSEITSFYYDLIAGTAYLMVKEGTADNPLQFKTIPFSEMAIEEGPDGMPDHYYREFKIKNELVKKTWADAKYSFEEGKEQDEASLLEVTYLEKNKWVYNVIDMDKKKVILERNFKTSPFICLRWTKSSNEIYGRGCGLKVLSDVKTLNKIKEYSLRALAFTVPVFTASTDGSYDPSKFVMAPGAINPVPSNLTNNPTIQQVGVALQPDLEQFKSTELEMNIKKGMFDTTIPNDPSNMTATEINQRAGELAEQLNNSFGRLINEFLYPLVKRIVEILQNFGYLDSKLDVKNFNGFGYKIKINTVLANQQRSTELNSIIQFFNVMSAFDPQMTFTNRLIKLNELGVEVAKLSGIPYDKIRSAEEMEQLEQQEAMAIQQQQQKQMVDNVAMNNAIEQGKADAEQNARRSGFGV